MNETITVIDPDDPIFEALDQLTAQERFKLAKAAYETDEVDLTLPDFLAREGGAR